MKPVAINKVSREVREFIFAELNKRKYKPETEKAFYVGLADNSEDYLWHEDEGLLQQVKDKLMPIKMNVSDGYETLADRQDSHNGLWRMFIGITLRRVGTLKGVEITMFSSPVMR